MKLTILTNLKPKKFKTLSYFQGNGTKNIVLFGNSHARCVHFGVEYTFRDIYQHLTLFSIGSCLIVPWFKYTSLDKNVCLNFKKLKFLIIIIG